MSVIFGSPEAQAVVEADRKLWREHRTQVQAEAPCPGCGQTVQLVAETDEWIREGQTWAHAGYGPAQGICEDCGALIVDIWDDCRVYRLAAAGDGST